MKDDIKTLAVAVCQFFAGALLSVAAFYLYIYSAEHRLETESLIEIAQETAVGIGAVFMYASARVRRDFAGGLLLIAGFLTALFIRELDAYFDVIVHGFWKYILIIYLCGLALLIVKAGRETILPGLAGFIRSSAFPLMLVGTVMVIVYSRLYGFKGLWALYGQGCAWGDIKSFSEETSELIGYTLMCVSALFYRFRSIREG